MSSDFIKFLEHAEEEEFAVEAPPNTLKPAVELTPQQEEGILKIQDFLDSAGVYEFKFGGYAGTGKTTVTAWLCSLLDIPYAVASFTGKAVSVLRRKGIYRAQTLHKLLYESFWSEQQKKWIHRSKEFLEYDFVLVDEASMVSYEIYEQLMAHGVKVLWVGDPGQLEPVGKNPNLMRDCDYVLEEVHRNAGPILQHAMRIRKGLPYRKEVFSDELIVTSKDHLKYLLEEHDFDVIICGKNETRHAVNKKLRKRYKHKGLLNEGEKVLCLNNSEEHCVYNGNTFTVDKLISEDADTIVVNLRDDLDNILNSVPLRKDCFGTTQDQLKPDKKRVAFDYGYALTCHKSQGSEWDKGLVIDEPIWNCDQKRWRYTAVTRMAKQLVHLV